MFLKNTSKFKVSKITSAKKENLVKFKINKKNALPY